MLIPLRIWLLSLDAIPLAGLLRRRCYWTLRMYCMTLRGSCGLILRLIGFLMILTRLRYGLGVRLLTLERWLRIGFGREL